VFGCRTVLEYDSSLAGVVQNQTREHNRLPSDADRACSKMAHVGIEGFSSRNAEEDAAQHEEASKAVGAQEANTMERVHSKQDRGMLSDPMDAQCGHDQEPQSHDGPEGAANPRRALRLEDKQPSEHQHRERDNVGLETRRGDLQPFKRREHRDRRRDRAVAIDEGRAEEANCDNRRSPMSLDANESHKRNYAALAVVIDPHGDGSVFNRRNDDQGPKNQRHDAEHDGRTWITPSKVDDGL